MAKADQIRKAVAEYMGPAGRRFQTRDITNSDIGKSYHSSNVSSALYSWASTGMLVNGYALEEDRRPEDGGRKFWQLKLIAGKPPEAEEPEVSKPQKYPWDVFNGHIVDTKKDGSFLVRSGDKFYTVKPLRDW